MPDEANIDQLKERVTTELSMSIEETKNAAIDYLINCDCWPLPVPAEESTPKWIMLVLKSMHQGNLVASNVTPIDHLHKLTKEFLLPVIAAAHGMNT
jgi:hypothetical protein